MSLFPAVRSAAGGGGGVGAQAQAQPSPSPSRTSVLQAQQQQQQQQQYAQTQQSPSNGATGALPRISSSSRVRDQQQQPQPQSTASSGVRRSGSKSRLEAALAASVAPSTSTPSSFAQWASPYSSGAAANSLRVTDARMAHPSPDATLSQPALWSSLSLDALNAYLSEPELSLAERALNGEKLPREHAALAAQVKRAHQALDVSKLPGVRHFAANFGCSEVGGKARVLFLQVENVQQVADAAGANGAGESGPTAVGVLQPPAGAVNWRIRTPTELDVSVEHWAALGGSDGGLDGPTDEQRYHQAVADRGVFSVRPRRGLLLPQQPGGAMIEVVYQPLFVGEHTLPLLFQTRGGKHFTLVVRARTVERMPALFSFHHLEETYEVEQRVPPAGGGDASGGKGGEEEKESVFLYTAPHPLHPFLPSPTPPSHTFTLHDVPIGLGLGLGGGDKEGGSDGAPVQCFPLLNHSGTDLHYRVSLSPFRRLKRRNYGVEVLSLLGQVVRHADPNHRRGEDAEAEEEEEEEEYIEGVVRAGSTGLLRFLFRPVEARTSTVRLRVELLHPDGLPRAQWLTVRGRGVLPASYALAPFPRGLPCATRPCAQTLLPPGQLVSLSSEVLDFGDVALFSRGSRVFTVRNMCAGESVQYAFVHALRPPMSQWPRGMARDRKVRALLLGDGEGQGGGDDPAAPPHASDSDEEAECLLHGELDPLESALLTFHPPGGLLAPGEAVLVRAELLAGKGALVMERDVALHVRVVSAAVDGDADAETEAGPVDHFGYNRTASVALGSRTPVTSSVPSAQRLRTAPRVDVRDGRPVSSLLGVGSGLAGMDVRVDYPAKPAVPLNVTTLARRAKAAPAQQQEQSESARLRAQTREGEATSHLSPTLSQLHSVPPRATWFPDATAAASELARASYNKLLLLVRARVAPAAQLEREARARREGFAGEQGAAQRLPQQKLTEVLNADSTVEQRFFVPRVEGDVTGGAAALTGDAASLSRPPPQQQACVRADPTAAAVVEASLLELLRKSLAQTTVTDSFNHLQSEPIPFFADLLAAHTGQPPVSEPAGVVVDAAPSAGLATASVSAAPSPAVAALAHSSGAFQNWSEAILNETLLKLTIEAQQPERSGFVLDATPKLFVRPPPSSQ